MKSGVLTAYNRDMKLEELEQLSKLMRYWVLKMTTESGSGHPTSCLSSVELMIGLMFGGFFRFKIQDSRFENNDRLIFSKGHAAPLLYALWAGAKDSSITEQDLMSLRKFDSPLEGHPTRRFAYTEVATGSLGQGLSVGVGMALNAKLNKLPYRTFVLLGDSEMAEGSNWEAIQLAKHYKLDNLMGIIDVNRLGQRGQTMYGHDVVAYKRRLKGFGWQTYTVDGHDLEQILSVYKQAMKIKGRPVMVIAKTVKGKGVSFLEDKNGWHGKALSKTELDQAMKELGEVNTEIRGILMKPEEVEQSKKQKKAVVEVDDDYGQPLATRKAYGHALVKLAPAYPQMVVLDAEVSNSTYSQEFKQAYPQRFLEMFIAEQNMVGTAVGLALRGKIPMVSTFAAFFTRAVDQIRVAQYSEVNVNFVGSHGGVSIGEDGPTQMGLEDLSIFRSILGSTVLYAADHVSEEQLVKAMIEQPGICYMRTTRMDTPSLYQPDEEFKIGGSMVVKQSKEDQVTVMGAGVTLYEALKAYEELLKEGIKVRVIDLYSIKPLDVETLKKAAEETKAMITVEDHFAEGGMGEAVASGLRHPGGTPMLQRRTDRISSQGDSIASLQNDGRYPIYSLAVRKMPRSGKPEELLAYEEIDSGAIVKKVKEIIKSEI